MTKNLKVKRLMAYLIDILIISLLVSLVTQIKGLNPNEKKYKEAQNDYTEYVESISNTEYTYSDLFNDDYLEMIYDLSYYSIAYYIIEVAIVILYFTLFPLFNNNQTIGKRLCKIKLEKENGKKLTIWSHLLRSLMLPLWSSIILYTNISTILNIISLLIFKENSYYFAYSIITIIICIYSYVDVIMLFASKDGKSLHDKILKTKVIEC